MQHIAQKNPALNPYDKWDGSVFNWVWDVGTLSWIKMTQPGGGGGPDPVGLKDTTATSIDPAIKQYQDSLAAYQFGDYDDTTTANVIYIGNSRTDGGWVIYKYDSSAKSMRYASGAVNYPANWANRVALTYNYFDVEF